MVINPFKTREFKSESTNKSKLKFVHDFKKELKETIGYIDSFLEKNYIKSLSINSIETGNNSIKIKIKDETKKINKLFNCVFKYSTTDEKYWNCNIDLTVSELSEKPKISFLWKYNVMDREKIKEKLIYSILLEAENIN